MKNFAVMVLAAVATLASMGAAQAEEPKVVTSVETPVVTTPTVTKTTTPRRSVSRMRSSEGRVGLLGRMRANRASGGRLIRR